MAFLGQLFGNYVASKQYRGQAKVARAKGRAERAAAYGQAARAEDEGKAANLIAAENAVRQRGNERKALGAVRNQRANSGFTFDGSGMQAELSVAEQMEQVIQDTALSGAFAERNAREEARVIRGNGEIAMMQAENIAQQYEQMAKNAKQAALVQGLAGLAGTVVGAFTGGLGGALQLGTAFGDVAGQFTQFMPGSVGASEGSSAAFGTDINEIWKAFGGSDLFGNDRKSKEGSKLSMSENDWYLGEDGTWKISGHTRY